MIMIIMIIVIIIIIIIGTGFPGNLHDISPCLNILNSIRDQKAMKYF